MGSTEMRTFADLLPGEHRASAEGKGTETAKLSVDESLRRLKSREALTAPRSHLMSLPVLRYEQRRAKDTGDDGGGERDLVHPAVPRLWPQAA